MMRRYHRWLATIAGIFLLWISVTGVLTQAGRIYAGTQPKPAAAAPAAGPEHAPPPPSPTRKFVKFVTDLHSGESFGLTGQLVSLAAGLAMVFLAISGLTMYIQIWRGRLVRVEAGKTLRGGKWFWS